MAYPIPKEVEYHERIAFNLTSKQLLYIVAAGVLSFQCFNILKNILPFPLYFLPPYIIAMAGLAFAFLDLEDLVRDLITYHSWVRKGGYLDEKVRNFVEVEAVRNGVIFLRGGGMRAVLQVTPINFSMLDAERKKEIASMFSSFLQQLSHPVQFHIKTVNVNLAPYFEKNEMEIREKHPELLPIYRDFVQYEERLVTENAVRNRLFYIVVPLEKWEASRAGLTTEARMTEMLDRRVRIVQEGLERAGLASLRLDTQQLTAFVASYFEDRIMIGNEYLSALTMLNSYVEKKEAAIRDAMARAEQNKESDNKGKGQAIEAKEQGKQIIAKIKRGISDIECKLTASLPKLQPSDYLGRQWEVETELVERFRKIMLRDIICPANIETKKDYIKVNETYYRVVVAQGFPAQVETGWLDRLISTRENYDITIHVEPFSIEAAKVMLHNQIIKEQADYQLATQKGTPNPSLANKLESTKALFDWLDRGEEKLFGVSIYVMCKANNLEQLNYLTDKCKADLNSVSIIPKVPYYRMAPAMLSVIPLGTDKLQRKREFPTSALAASFPFISSTPELEDTGILLGHDRNNLNPIIKDPCNLSNMHAMVLAKSGAGKSYTAKLLITRMLMKGTRVFIIDPSNEYERLCRHYGGQVIKISRDSDNIINPLDLCGEEYLDKRISLMGLFSIICGGLTPPLEGALDKALKETYARKGITEDRDTWKNKPPKMSDLLAVLREMFNDAKRNRLYDTKRTLQALITRVEKYCKGGVYSFVDNDTRMNTDSMFVVFDIKDLPDEVKSMYMYMILDYVTGQCRQDLERKMIVIDEGWSLLNQEKSAEHLLWLTKSSRKFNTGIVFITQEVNDLIGNKAGESILANTSIKILLQQDGASIEALSELLHLNMQERNLLTTARRGEGLLIIENTTRIPISIKASPSEHSLITTNPEELVKLQGEENAADSCSSCGKGLKECDTTLDRHKVIKISPDGTATVVHLAPRDDGIFDLRNGFFRKAELSEDQIRRCIENGYEELRISQFGEGGSTIYLVKPEHNESLEHAFFRHTAAKEAWKYSKEVRTNATNGPDVEFDAPCGTVAIEIETGKAKRSRDELVKKFENLVKNYADYFILVTDWNLKREYEDFGTVITRTELRKKIASYFTNPENGKNGSGGGGS